MLVLCMKVKVIVCAGRCVECNVEESDVVQYLRSRDEWGEQEMESPEGQGKRDHFPVINCRACVLSYLIPIA